MERNKKLMKANYIGKQLSDLVDGLYVCPYSKSCTVPLRTHTSPKSEISNYAEEVCNGDFENCTEYMSAAVVKQLNEEKNHEAS